MSMISAKCDRLRDTATRVEIFLEGCTDAIPMDTHEQLRSAANTILELRKLARDLRFCARQSNCLKCEHGRICNLRLDERCKELGIEVGE